MTAGERWLVVGGAGFLGSHFVDRLLGSGGAAGVTVYDNFSSGQEWHLEQHGDDDRVVRTDQQQRGKFNRGRDRHGRPQRRTWPFDR